MPTSRELEDLRAAIVALRAAPPGSDGRVAAIEQGVLAGDVASRCLCREGLDPAERARLQALLAEASALMVGAPVVDEARAELDELRLAQDVLRATPPGSEARPLVVEQLVAPGDRAAARLREGEVGGREREQLLALMDEAMALVARG